MGGKLLFIILGLLLGWVAYRNLRAQPEALSRENLSKSFKTLGLLGLGLIVFVALCVLLLKN